MRFLCLHGMGTNSDVYEAQLAPIRAQLDPSHEFVFVDGLEECPPSHGVDDFFQGPFYCYYSKPTPERLEAAFDLIEEVMEEDGPFDGIFGFSQGAALAASFLMHRQKTASHLPDPFSMAVFTCASLPFDLDTEFQKSRYNTVVCPDTGDVSVRNWVEGQSEVEPVNVNGFIVPLEPGDVTLRRYHPAREPARIRIPTVHIRGENDPFYQQQKVLSDLCAEKSILDHRAGHQLPRDSMFGRKAAMLIQRAIDQASFRC